MTIDVTHLRRVAVTAPDAEALVRFYEAVWGLHRVAVEDGVTYLRGTGEEHHIVAIHPGERSSMFRYTVGVGSAAAVDAAADELAGNPAIHVVRPPAAITEPGGGYGMVIADPDGREIELPSDVAAAGPAEYTATILPRKLSHVVLNSPHVDAYAALMIDLLGFRLADEAAHMVFLKCNRDHHTVALARAPHASLNHIAFEVPTVEDVRGGIEHLRTLGHETIWGPGRHAQGKNVFGYFVTPNGHVVEYTADVEQIDDADLAPRFWAPEDYEIYDDWADVSSLRPTAEARQIMLGAPERYPHAEIAAVETAKGPR
jgi:catechol 2,3-dioxygenase-like lactoylglutathione lyase family enzyme